MPQLPENRLPESPASASVPMELAALQRRRALLSGLGKGAAATAALAPLVAQARGTHKIANSTLPGGFGYCTVSGFQSAAISGSPAPTVCSAFAPSHFLTVDQLNYLTISGASNASSINKNNLSVGLNTFFSLPAGTITPSAVELTLLAAVPVKLIVTGHNVAIIPLAVNSGTGLRPTNFPAAVTNSLAAFNSTGLFTASSDSRSLLEVLYDAVLSSSPANANCYFLAAYLTVYNSTPSNLPLGFDKTYVVAQYVNNAGSSTNAYKFFQALCVTP